MPSTALAAAALEGRKRPFVRARRKVMIVTNLVPGYDIGFQQSGHARYLGAFIDHFRRRGFEIILVALRPSLDFVRLRASELPYALHSPALRVAGEHLVVRSLSGTLRALAWSAFARMPQRMQAFASAVRARARLARGFVHHLGTFIAPAEAAFVRRVEVLERPSVVMYDSIFNCCPSATETERWVITQDVKYLRARSFEAHGFAVSPAGLSRDAERHALRDVGNVIAIHWDDADEFRRLVPDAQVIVVPVTIDLPTQPVQPSVANGSRCVFVGSGSFHNVDGIEWFLEQVWPAIRATVPHATLDVYGTVCQRLGHVPAGVTLHGVVADIARAYDGAALAVVPLRIGSGLKVKLVEALVFGVPTVTTSVGAQGLRGVAPRPFELADAAEDFADRCITVLQSASLRAELSASAVRCAGLFSPDHAFAELAAATTSKEAGE